MTQSSIRDKKPDFRPAPKPLTRYPLIRPFYKFLIKLGASDEHWARVVMNRETREMVSRLDPGNLKVFEISGHSWGKWMSFKEYKGVDFPDFDICESALGETFDLIIAEQVFEHLLWPYRAGRNVYKMLNPGGSFLITTPFLMRVHNRPVDCSRWTETGIKYFLAECGFDIRHVRTGSWGNRACVRANFSVWMPYRRLFHSLRNDPEFPVAVWALARK
ncbi:MAG: methyltransferase domain-containing protein [Gammaproteobacteria bacterium]